MLWRTARLEGPGFRQLEDTARDVVLELSLSALRGAEPVTWTVLPEGSVHLAVAGRRCTLNPHQVQALYDALGEALARDALSQWMNEPQAAEAAKVAGGVTLYVLLCALLIWVLERGETFQRDFKRGVPEAIWWTLVTMSTVGYGDYAPKRPLGRVISAVIILSGIALFGVLVAEVTSMVTLSELRPSIQSPDDLAGKRVGVLRDTIAVEAVGLRRGRRIEFATLDEACRALREERVRAVVHDRPLLRYRLQNEPGGLTLVGGAFNVQDYAIAFPLGSEQRRPVNQALLRLREEEAQATYRGLLNRWLGEE